MGSASLAWKLYIASLMSKHCFLLNLMMILRTVVLDEYKVSHDVFILNFLN